LQRLLFVCLQLFNPSLRLRRLHEGWEEKGTRKIFLNLIPYPVRPELVEGNRTKVKGDTNFKKMIQNLLFSLAIFFTIARFPSTGSGRTD